MIRILALLLCLVLAFSLAACGGNEAGTETNTETGSNVSSEEASASSSSADTSSDISTDTESGATSSEKEEKPAVQLYDPTMEHKVIMDDSGTKIIIADLNLCGDDPNEINIEDCIVWEWDSAKATGAALQGKDLRIDEANLRYSEYWKKDVVIFSGSGGWVGIIDYATKEVLFEDKPGNGPHSVELLPNGDLVVACSGNGNAMGTVLHYPISEGKKKTSATVELESAHGICWDPTNEVIWVLGGNEIIACSINNGVLTKIGGMGASLKKIGHGGGHDFVPVYGQPGKYWISGDTVMLFDANEETITDSFSHSAAYQDDNVKGIAWFPDGTMITTAHDQGGTGTYRSSEFRYMYLGYSEGKVKKVEVKTIMIPHREGSQTYKIHTLSKDYQ